MNYPDQNYQTKNDNITLDMPCDYCGYIISIPQVYNQSNSIIAYGWKCTRCGNNCSISIGGQRRGTSDGIYCLPLCLPCSIL